ncbi:hypothetical protein EAH79_09510 [Sphingomonas koreensis]|nr:hypothetical protein EAH87_05525 [Sphingomonas koreensis]TPG41308.1 hypothetical protein EAH79_09510 [Sphingomonas koreensis]
MRIARTMAALGALAVMSVASPALAQIGAEANIDHADGHNGAELGAGYAVGLAGFSLTPGLGAQISDHHTHLYGRVEAAYQIPLSVKIGAGVRFTEDHSRVYGTAALPLLPKVMVKGNLGPKYYALGLTLGY